MIKKYLWPLIKRFKGLFISMVFTGMLALGLLMAFTNSYINLVKTYPRYFNEFGAPTVIVDTDFHNTEDEINDILHMEGVQAAETRMTIDCYLKRNDGRQITTRIYTYKEDSLVNKLYVKESLEQSILDRIAELYKKDISLDTLDEIESPIWVSMDATFAENNNIKLGDTIKLGAFGLYLPVRVGKLVLSPETIYVRVKDYIWTDNNDFGLIYVNPGQAVDYLHLISRLIDYKASQDPEFKAMVDAIIETAKIYFPDYSETKLFEEAEKFVNYYGNQVSVIANGNNSEQIANKIKDYFTAKGVKVKDSHLRETTTSYVYISKAARQIRIAAIFLPVFFYAITLFVIILFINQMVKSMTSEIGIMMSIGIRSKEITGLFSLFILIMSIVSSIFGFGFAMILLNMLQSIFIKIYHIPYIIGGINPILLAGGVLSLILIGQGAVLLASKSIYRITPKDAMISNEGKRKSLPKWLDRTIEKSPMSIKLGINSVAQNMRRFLVSVFSIFAALTMTVITMTFVDAKNELLDQTLNRRLIYDCQVYMTETVTQKDIDDLKQQKFIKTLSTGEKGVANGLFTYLEISNGDQKLMLQTVGLADDTPKDLIYIPDSTGKKDMEIKGQGIILDKGSATTLKVDVGDVVRINNHDLRVDAISYQYFNMTQYMKMDVLKTLTDQYASTLFVNTNNEIALLDYFSARGTNSLTVFSSALKADLSARLSSINVFAYILVAFSIGMGLVILSIMTQNALLEQKRNLSILRAVGFRTIDVSNIWMIQSFLQLLISNAFAIPIALLTCNILFKTASSASQVYPFVVNPLSLTLCFIFILSVIGFAHLFAMVTISKWNLADNTRSRE